MQHLRAWSATLDQAGRSESASLLHWAVTTAIFFGIVIVSGSVEPIADFYRLDFWPALLCALPATLFSLGYCVVARVFPPSPAVWAAYVVTYAALVLFFAASLVFFSAPPGSALFAAVLVLLSGYFGYILRVAPARPLGLLVTLAAVACAALLPHEARTLHLLAMLLPIAGLACLALGALGLRSHRQQLEREALRGTIDIQMLQGRDRDVGRLSHAILQVLQQNHDASNALSTALLNAELLATGTTGAIVDPGLSRTSAEILDSLKQLKQLLDETRQLGQAQAPHPPAGEPVVVSDVVRSALSIASTRFPDIRFRYERFDEEAASLRADVCDGYEGLHRILDELILNACEGDGERAARDVEVHIRSLQPTDIVFIQVVDDGPGFLPEQLSRSIRGFDSTKIEGSGLGLYTADRLARASGGSLHRENLPGAGAVVSVSLHASAAPA